VARNEQLIRQYKILQILERYRFGRTLAEIRDEAVDELGLTSLHERSVRRDLAALQIAGFDIVDVATQRGRVWKFGPRIRPIHRITASATELVALSVGRDLMTPLYGTPLWQGIESFWSKIQESLPESVLRHYQKMRSALYVQGMPPKSYERQQGMLKSLQRAILEHRVVEIEYRPVNREIQRRRIEPYALIVHRTSLYAVAADHALEGPIAERLRHWKLDRFQKATLLDTWFEPPPDFDIERHLKKSLGVFSVAKPQTYTIRLSSSAAAWISEDPWHPEQHVEWQPDGSARLTVSAGEELEVVLRVLALGDHAELIAPAAARRTLAQMIGRIAAQYDKSK